MSPTPSDAPRPTAAFDAHSQCPEGSVTNPGAQPPLACHVPGDVVLDELAALGKPGIKIERAREEVLQILSSANACAEWFQTKDRRPAETFQSLDFSLDANGPRDVFTFMQDQSILVIRQPYVARATQDGGAHTTITINAYGAFYRPQGQVQKTVKEGGPALRDGVRLLTVGSFRGDTLPAQMVTLLHEFGHVIDLLPEDADNLDGKSMRNTDEVLRHCRAEIAVRAQGAKHK